MERSDPVFAGSVPELYTRYMGPMFFQPYADELARRAARLAKAEVLETACGTGIVTRTLAHALQDAVAITATDLNQPMIDHAKTLPGDRRINWQQADAQALPFADAAFDTAICSFGVMFFPDKVLAHRETRRVLRPGGHFMFTVWDRLETLELQFLAHTAVAALFPHDPPDFFRRTPCSYHDIDVIRADLASAGFGDADVETLEMACRSPSAHDAATGLVRGTPLSGEIAARDPARMEDAVEATAEAIVARFGAGPVSARMQAHVVTARV